MSGLFLDIEIFHWVVPLSVLGASLVGSPHCVAMCGPLALNFARQGRKGIVVYQMGRAFAYAAAGAAAGALGGVSFGAKAMPWLSVFSLFMIGLILISGGTRLLTNRPLHLPLPKFVERSFARLSQGVWSRLLTERLSPSVRAWFGGMLTVFLPCGHLYGFLAGAVATGSTLAGMTFMIAFWLGTVPALGLGIGWFASILRPGLQKGPRWSGLLLIVAGLISLAAFASRMTEAPVSKHDSILCRQ